MEQIVPTNPATTVANHQDTTGEYEPRPTDIFKQSFRDLYDISAKVHEQLEDEDIDVDSLPPYTLWTRIAAEANNFANEHFDNPEQSERAAMLNLTAMTPLAFMTQRSIDFDSARNITPPTEKITQRKAIMSTFSRAIRNVGECAPTTYARALGKHLVESLRKSDVHPEPEFFEGEFMKKIRGAQHELGARKLLEQLGEVREANLAEDLSYIDLVLQYQGASLPIDIKSSPNSVFHTSGGASDIVCVKSGRIVLFSHLTPEDIGDNFQLAPEIITKRSQQIKFALELIKDNPLIRQL